MYKPGQPAPQQFLLAHVELKNEKAAEEYCMMRAYI